MEARLATVMTTAGEGTGSPDFIGVGTQRSGTTWWFMSLLEHPGIRAPRSGNKETHFLTRFARGPMTDADVEHYYHRRMDAALHARLLDPPPPPPGGT